MSLSSGYLRKLFRASEGSGISEFIVNVRLDAAKDLLLNTNLTASAIAEKVGIFWHHADLIPAGTFGRQGSGFFSAIGK